MKRLIRIAVYIYYRYIVRDSITYHRKLGTKVGDGCRIYPFNFTSEPFLIEIGDKVTITSGVRLLTHDGATWLIRDDKGRRHLYKKIIIGNSVFIGIDSIIMPGVTIEDRVIVAAGSVVTKSIPSGKIVAGNPARIIGNYNEFEKHALLMNVSDADLNWLLSFKDRIMENVDLSRKKYLS